MIILPAGSTKLLLPEKGWNPSSHDPFTQTRFRVRALLNDGHPVWTGWFDDREDFDRFLWSIFIGELRNDTFVQRLPSPWWNPDLGEGLTYDFSTVTFLTATTATNWPVPADWNVSNNTCEVLAGGAGAAGGSAGAGIAGGGGAAGGYSSVSNLASVGANFRYTAATAGTGGGSSLNGSAGGDSWFSNTAVAPTTTSEGALAKGGSQGLASGIGGTGTITGAIGTTKNKGGDGGAGTPVGTDNGGGGGGAAYSTGAGGNGASGASANGGNGAGSGGGTGGTTAAPGNPGGNGTNWDSTHGTGGGGGGGDGHVGAATGGNGGNYGGAGGGGGQDNCSSDFPGGNGKQGLVVVTYLPFVPFPGTHAPSQVFRKTTVVGY